MTAVSAAGPIGPSDVVPLAVTDRSGMVESVHHGVAVAIDRDGEVAFAAGNPDAVIYPRSANKPMQADAMLRLGLSLDPPGVALACASHGGSEPHLDVVRSILADHGLGVDALDNTPAMPLDPDAAHAWCRRGGEADPLHQNCSGKHAAMLATCVVRGWPTDGYLDPSHPLQQAITEHVRCLAGPVAHIGVDGCGAPAHALSTVALAQAFARLARERTRVWVAMNEHPDLVGGPTRDVTLLIRSVPGLMAKDGAEGVLAAALPDGRAAAVKIGDGAARAAGVVLGAVLRRVDVDVPTDAIVGTILGHGRPVGEVRPLPR